MAEQEQPRPIQLIRVEDEQGNVGGLAMRYRGVRETPSGGISAGFDVAAMLVSAYQKVVADLQAERAAQGLPPLKLPPRFEDLPPPPAES